MVIYTFSIFSPFNQDCSLICEVAFIYKKKVLKDIHTIILKVLGVKNFVVEKIKSVGNDEVAVLICYILTRRMCLKLRFLFKMVSH